MNNQQERLPAGWLPQKLREALAQVPGLTGALPSLPVLEAGVLGQHILVMFCLGTPPPALLGPPGAAQPAVTLHIIWPQGYWYWQPETGTLTYLGGVPQPALLPAAYQQLLNQRSQLPPVAAIEDPAVSRYLSLLEEVLFHDWLSPHATTSTVEKQVAHELQQLWRDLGEAHYQEYYRVRGEALLTWIAQATYQSCWVEEALAVVAATAPPNAQAAEVSQGMFVPAWLDGQQCLVVPFFKSAPANVSVGSPAIELVVACYIAYPTYETYWHSFSEQPARATLATYPPPGHLLPDALKPAAVAEVPSPQAVLSYYRLVTALLKAGWLVTRPAVSPTEAELAAALTEAFAAVRTPELLLYYSREAWQFLNWLACATGTPQT